ncbi:PKHD-type hydroxylase [Methylobacterium adhaesivum]|jgi:PKHD-type hydroxylase|uniref:Fe2+-dependent dioxygenase n=1 Tax=Methylobacterium adhaesivum TaxID=333297 RepID=A0ABT8BJN2_9HYPH|nr:Fe2+-dependent dioxygenase [Methylobacterium adhaesivum]MDN3591974.1 Fe2+-dependent dioxygenase [Methylobacterium adhaesivum]GJD32628.1 PKHD-type hydroxylase [Methylobacterium adhaesivum]
MLVHVKDVLSAEEVAHCRARLEAGAWVDGRVTAGAQAARAKNNLQIPEDSAVARELGDLILRALGRNPQFNAVALPLRVLPPLFNRYDVGMGFGAHVDGAIRMVPGAGIRMRADISTTLFLTDPDDYDGGELVIEDTFGAHAIKLPAGDMIVYPATSLHRVEPITRGARWSAFFWSQSMVKDDGARALLYDLDRGITGVRDALSDDNASVIALTSTYHNLLRRWAEL